MTDLDEPLERIYADLRDRPPTPLGQVVVRSAIHAGLTTRRKLDRVGSVPMKRPPIVICGWYRTGTTFLQEALGAGIDGYGFAPMHRLLEPVRAPGSRLKAAVALRAMRTAAPEIAELHPTRVDGPEECWMLLAAHLLVDGWAMHWDLPRFGAWLETVDRRPAYRTWAKAIGRLSAELGVGLVCKDPAHAMGMEALWEVCPDAIVVVTHRERGECIESHSRLVDAQHRLVYGVSNRERARRICAERYQVMNERIGKWPGRRVDVDFAELKDIEGVIRRVL